MKITIDAIHVIKAGFFVGGVYGLNRVGHWIISMLNCDQKLKGGAILLAEAYVIYALLQYFFSFRLF